MGFIKSLALLFCPHRAKRVGGIEVRQNYATKNKTRM